MDTEESPSPDNKIEIFKLADWDDALKHARFTMVQKLTQMKVEEDVSSVTDEGQEGSFTERKISTEVENVIFFKGIS